MDFELIRFENDEKLLLQLDAIKTAENVQVLIPFAKAYLGMFYVIDSDLTAVEKVKLLANSELAKAILAGFLASLNSDNLPSIEKIGHAMAVKNEFPEGYVILAGLDLLAKNSLHEIASLNTDFIATAVGFHFSNKTGSRDTWFDHLFAKHENKIIPAISLYWTAMLKNNATYLPGINFVLGDKLDIRVTQYCILPLLQHWIFCKEKTLSRLLHLAFKYSEVNQFLTVCEHVLKNDERLNEKTRLYWLTAACLLSPDKYFTRLADYVGRVKLKVMPLLDFIILILNDKNKINIKFSDKLIAQLLRLIAPVFPPQHHVYGALGTLDINSKNVMLMFYHLACSNNSDVAKEIKLLRKARVMKTYSGVIDNLLELHIRKNNDKNFSLPDFNEYIAILVNDNCLQGRSNKFDLR